MASVLETPIKTVAAEEPLRSGDVLIKGRFIAATSKCHADSVPS